MKGSIVDRNGAAIVDVVVIASGVGFRGWTTSGSDGAFKLPAVGAFVSFRHAGYLPVLVRSSEAMNPVRLQMSPADDSVLKLRLCNFPPSRSGDWIGSGLHINAGTKHKGPVYGEHDTHWYVSRGKDQLHVVNGYAWHAGLPFEGMLVRSESIVVRGWEFDTIVGLDLSGHTSDGKYWRWFGAPVEEAIEYETSSRDTADEFDGIIATMCFQAPAPIKR